MAALFAINAVLNLDVPGLLSPFEHESKSLSHLQRFELSDPL
ncbi:MULTISPECIES: hypothetical protein [Oceanobacillus]